MKILFKTLLILFSGTICLQAQTISFSKGVSFKYSGENYSSLGQTDRFVFYKESNEDNLGNYLLKFDIKTLDMVERVNLDKLIINGNIEFVNVLNDQLYIMTCSDNFNKSRQVSSTIKVYTCNANSEIRNISEQELCEFTCTETPNVYFMDGLNLFVVSNGEKTARYFNLSFAEVQFPSQAYKYPLPVNYKFIRINYSSEEGNRNKQEKFFYPFSSRGDIRYYVKSEFARNDTLYKTKGHIQSLEIVTYDTVKNFRKESYKFDIREASFLMDYNVQLMKDGRILIIGIYQDRTEPGENIRLGLFSKIIEADFRDKIPAFYLEILNAKKDSLEVDPKRHYIFNYFGYSSYFFSQMEYKGNYFSHTYSYPCPVSCYDMVLVNKQTAFISFEKLPVKTTCNGDNWFMGGFLSTNLKDSLMLILFNDNSSNKGLAASDPEILTYGDNPDSIMLAFVLFTVGRGFGKRQMLYDGATERFFIRTYSFESLIGEPDAEGRFDIFTLAYDMKQKNCRLYRFDVRL